MPLLDRQLLPTAQGSELIAFRTSLLEERT